MKDTELDHTLQRLVASTRTPRGRFSAATSYRTLAQRLPRKQSHILSMPTYAASAAAVALLCLLGWFTYDYLRPERWQTISTLAEVRIIQLPDGSEVTLNHFSSLTYPECFKKSHREVTLNGEAYFEVAKDQHHPFVVLTEAIDVQVLGTHFNVEAYRRDPEVKTTLFEGSVAVSNKELTERIVLRPNESAIYNKVKKQLTHETAANAPERMAWRDGNFLFNNLPLQEIARQLSNSFGVDIRIADKALRNYRLTARFTNGESLKQMLDLLHQAGGFDYSHNDNTIIITPKPN